MIGARLRGRVRRVGRVRRRLVKRSGVAERAVHLVGQTPAGIGMRFRRSALRVATNRREASSSSNAPTVLVATKFRGPSIDRSTWLSAAKFTTAVGR